MGGIPVLYANSSMGFWDIMSAVFSLILIVGIVVLAYFVTRWYAKKSGPGQGATGRHIKVVDRASLSATVGVAIVQVGDTHYLVGVSEKNIQLLTQLEDFEKFVEESPVEAPQAFGTVFRSLLSKTGFPPKDNGGKP